VKKWLILFRDNAAKVAFKRTLQTLTNNLHFRFDARDEFTKSDLLSHPRLSYICDEDFRKMELINARKVSDNLAICRT